MHSRWRGAARPRILRRMDTVGTVYLVGAGPGDVVLYASGSSARQTTITKDKPCDAVIMAIVDSWDVDGKNVYEKWS